MTSEASPRDRVGPWTIVPLGIGLCGTFLLAIGTVVGRFAVPIAAQQVVDRGRLLSLLPPAAAVWGTVALGAATVAGSVLASYLLHTRIARRSEVMLDVLRRRAIQARQRPSDRAAVRPTIEHLERISQFVRWAGPTQLVNAAVLAAAAVALFAYSWPLALAVMLTFACLVPAQVRIARRLGKQREQLRGHADRIRVRLDDIVSRAEAGASGARQRHAAAAFEADARKRDLAGRQEAREKATGSVSSEVAMAAAMALTVGGGALLGRAGDLSPGRLIAFMLVLITVAAPLQGVVADLAKQRQIVISWRRIVESVLDAITPGMAMVAGFTPERRIR